MDVWLVAVGGVEPDVSADPTDIRGQLFGGAPEDAVLSVGGDGCIARSLDSLGDCLIEDFDPVGTVDDTDDDSLRRQLIGRILPRGVVSPEDYVGRVAYRFIYS